MAMLCVIGWLFPGAAPLWLLLPEPFRQRIPSQFVMEKTNQPFLGFRKTVRRIRAPCQQGIWTSPGIRLEGG